MKGAVATVRIRSTEPAIDNREWRTQGHYQTKVYQTMHVRETADQEVGLIYSGLIITISDLMG